MKTFLYKFSDGSEIYREPTRATMDEIEQICAEQGIKLIYNGFTDQLNSLHLLRANSHSSGDGFKPGYQPALGIHVSSHEQFQSELKQRGLVEVGREKQSDAPKVKSSVFTEDVIKEAVAMGADISGRQADALVKGESISE
jgi:hypothetical protein